MDVQDTSSGIPAMVSAMNGNPLQAKMQNRGCRTLENLAAMNDRNRMAIARAGGIPEMIREGENGYLGNVKDPDGLSEKLLAILDQDNSSLVEAAFQTVQRFSKKETAKQTLELYQRLLP